MFISLLNDIHSNESLCHAEYVAECTVFLYPNVCRTGQIYEYCYSLPFLLLTRCRRYLCALFCPERFLVGLCPGMSEV